MPPISGEGQNQFVSDQTIELPGLSSFSIFLSGRLVYTAVYLATGSRLIFLYYRPFVQCCPNT